MCRYAEGEYGPYKDHYACFDCRKAFKQTSFWELPEHARPSDPSERVCPCPECGQPMHDMGLDFKAPRQSDVKQWKKVRLLFENGFTYHSCGCCGPGYRPNTVKEAEVFIHESTPLSEAQKLLKKHVKRRHSSSKG